MNKVLDSVKNKPANVRTTIALVLAFACTAGIAVLWVGTWTSPQTREATAKAPSPLSALGSTIKSTVKNSDWKFSSSSDTQVEIIDASTAPVLHDETDPYQDSMPTQ